MKKRFGHTKRPVQPWKEYDESEYDWDGADEASGEEAEYAYGEEPEGDIFYSEAQAYGQGGYGDDDVYIEEAEDYEDTDSIADEIEEYEEADDIVDEIEEYEDTYDIVDEIEEYEEADDSIDEIEEYEEADDIVDEIEEYEDTDDSIDEIEEYEDTDDIVDEIEEYEEADDVVDEIEEYEDADRIAEEIEGYENSDCISREAGEYIEELYGDEQGAENADGIYGDGDFWGYAGEYDAYAGNVAGEESDDYAEDYDGYADGTVYTEDYRGYAGSAEYAEDYNEYADAEEYADENEMPYNPADYDGDEYSELEDIYKQKGLNTGKKGFLTKLAGGFRNMDTMDRIMAAVGVGVLILAVVTGGVFASSFAMRSQIAGFADVGTQLEGITMIGEQGLMAVADAEVARIMAAAAPVEEVVPEQEPEPPKEYDEKEYGRQVTVNPDFTSIQRDLKIKFINKKTDKLVANVPFSVMVTGPDGKTYIWSDDDMDGIIYKKDIASGSYQVVMETLDDSKYADYIISTDVRTVQVKEEIAYVKVDVENEVKQETEVDVAQEDTKVNEVVVESTLQDTVAWVESKIIGVTYSEVAKSTIADPATLALGKVFWRMSANSTQTASPSPSPSEPGESATPDPSQEPTESPSPNPSQEPTESPSPDPSQEPTESPSPDPSQEPTESPSPDPSQEPTESPSPDPSPEPIPGKVSVDNAALTGAIGAKLTAKATVSDFAENGKISFSIGSDKTSVATATIDSDGNISITGVAAGTAVLTVTAKCEVRPEGAEDVTVTEATATIRVTIADKLALTLDKTSLTAYTDEPVVINAEIVNALAKEPVLTAESSDTKIATVKVDKNAITITGAAAGSAVITVKYKEEDQEVQATCTVTVKMHPKNDKETRLKDLDGNQLYVMENDSYREAVYADYYTADKFYIKGEVRYSGWQTIEGRVYYFTAEGEKVTGEHIIQGAKYNFASDGSLMVGSGEIGIDVSKWNGTIDWNAVKNSGISYVIIRCGYRGSSEGKLIEDSKFESNIKGATAAGLKVGIYFFSQAVDEVEAVEEASMVLALIKNYTISYPVFLDVETSGGRGDNIDRATRTAVCKAFCQTIQNANYTAGVYSNKTWLETKLNAGELSAYKIWLAQYAATPTYTGRYDMWQYRSTGSVSGISGDVDMNISYLGY